MCILNLLHHEHNTLFDVKAQYLCEKEEVLIQIHIRHVYYFPPPCNFLTSSIRKSTLSLSHCSHANHSHTGSLTSTCWVTHIRMRTKNDTHAHPLHVCVPSLHLFGFVLDSPPTTCTVWQLLIWNYCQVGSLTLSVGALCSALNSSNEVGCRTLVNM
jgi:hypothetical protein